MDDVCCKLWVIAALTIASQRSRVGVGMKRSVRMRSVKRFKLSN